MIDVNLLSKTCKVPGAPGYEQQIRSFVIEQVKPYVDEIQVDAMGNVIAIKKGTSDKKLMLAAHIDEIGFIVTHIDDEGFIRFHCLGGFDPKTLTAQRVIIHGKEDVIGVMGTKPIHVMDAKERSTMPKTKEYFIDTGLSADKVNELIGIGNPITRERELIEMGETVNAKSLDNRVSVFIVLETLRELQGTEVPHDVYAVFTVQEEIGLRGATAAASGVNPDFTINLDVTMAYDLPGSTPQEQVTKLGKGTAIKVLDGMTVCDYRMVAFMKEVAAKNDIPYQLECLTAGGTDTAALQRHARGGSIAGGISIPCRYLHQVIEMVHKSDVKNSIALLKHCILDINKYDWSFR